MPQPEEKSVTSLLEALREGDSDALNALFPLVYDELRALAHRNRLKWHGDYTLNTTALVHEAYLKLIDQTRAEWNSRAHFFSVAAKAMRHILINYAERRRAKKRGGDYAKVSLEEEKVLFEEEGALAALDDRVDDLMALDTALRRLEKLNERQCRIVECRFFGGMTIADTAAALDISPATVNRGWAMAQAWLHREISDLYE